MSIDLTDVREGDEITITVDLEVVTVEVGDTKAIKALDAGGEEYWFDHGDAGELVIKPRLFTPPPAGSVVRFGGKSPAGRYLALSRGDQGYQYLQFLADPSPFPARVWPWSGVENDIVEIIEERA